MIIIFIIIVVYAIELTMVPQQSLLINLDSLNVSDLTENPCPDPSILDCRIIRNQTSYLELPQYDNPQLISIQASQVVVNSRFFNCFATLFNTTHLLFILQEETKSLMVSIKQIAKDDYICNNLKLTQDKMTFLLDCYFKSDNYLLQILNNFNCLDSEKIHVDAIQLHADFIQKSYYLRSLNLPNLLYILKFTVYDYKSQQFGFYLFKIIKGVSQLIYLDNLNQELFTQLTDAQFLENNNDSITLAITSYSFGFYIIQITMNQQNQGIISLLHHMVTNQKDKYHAVNVFTEQFPYQLTPVEYYPQLTVLTHNYIMQFKVQNMFDDKQLTLTFKKIINHDYIDESFHYFKQLQVDDAYFYTKTIIKTTQGELQDIQLHYSEKRMTSQFIAILPKLFSYQLIQSIQLVPYNIISQLAQQENKRILIGVHGESYYFEYQSIQPTYLNIRCKFINTTEQIIELKTDVVLKVETISLNSNRVKLQNGQAKYMNATSELIFSYPLDSIFKGQNMEYETIPQSKLITQDSYRVVNSTSQVMGEFTLQFVTNEKNRSAVFSQYLPNDDGILYTLFVGPDNSMNLIVHNLTDNSTHNEQVQILSGDVTHFNVIDNYIYIVITLDIDVETMLCDRNNIQLLLCYQNRVNILSHHKFQEITVYHVSAFSHAFHKTLYFLLWVFIDEEPFNYLSYTDFQQSEYQMLNLLKEYPDQLITMIDTTLASDNCIFALDNNGNIYTFWLNMAKREHPINVKLKQFKYSNDTKQYDQQFKLIDFNRFAYPSPPGILIFNFNKNTIDLFYIRDIYSTDHEHQLIPLFGDTNLTKMKELIDFDVNNNIWFNRVGSLSLYQQIDQYLILFAYNKPKFEMHKYNLLAESGSQLKIIDCSAHTNRLWFIPNAYTLVGEGSRFKTPSLRLVGLDILMVNQTRYSFENNTLTYFFPPHFQIDIQNKHNLVAKIYNFQVLGTSTILNNKSDKMKTVSTSVRFELQDSVLFVNRSNVQTSIDLRKQDSVGMIDESCFNGSMQSMQLYYENQEIYTRPHIVFDDAKSIVNNGIVHLIPLEQLIFIQRSRSVEVMQISGYTAIILDQQDIRYCTVTKLSKDEVLLLILVLDKELMIPYFYQIIVSTLQIQQIHNKQQYSYPQHVLMTLHQLSIVALTLEDIYVSFVQNYDDCLAEWIDGQIVIMHANSTLINVVRILTSIDFKDVYTKQFENLQMLIINDNISLYFTDQQKKVYKFTLGVDAKPMEVRAFDQSISASYIPQIHIVNNLTYISALTSGGIILYNDTSHSVSKFKYYNQCLKPAVNAKQLLSEYSFGIQCILKIDELHYYAYYSIADSFMTNSYIRQLQQLTYDTQEHVDTLWLMDSETLAVIINSGDQLRISQYKLNQNVIFSNNGIPQVDGLDALLCANNLTQGCVPFIINNYSYEVAQVVTLIWSIALSIVLCIMFAIQFLMCCQYRKYRSILQDQINTFVYDNSIS